ncbi:MAG: ATP-binding protein [Cyclobacteriaceae bacterium]|nr:ATP-binding protein [Cyclobacteriaceae bacterium]
MKFLNRQNEITRLKRRLAISSACFIVVYGRRRCGKSTLLKRIIGENDLYFVAHQSDQSVLLNALAREIGKKIKGFEKLIYPDWEALLTNLDNTAKEQFTLCIDEFPYLVKSSPQLPSLLQRFLDNNPERKFHLILCGSSQQMMHGLILDSGAPLYGRAHEILKIEPLKAGYLKEAIECTASQAIEEYAVWGGVPRYWELRLQETSLEQGIKNLIFDRLGILHEEPSRLFLDDLRESVQAFSILSVIGNGVHRLSEIAGRLNKPSTHLGRPLEVLLRLGYLKREIPFGESLKSSKKGLYKISDPFINFYFSFVVPNLSRLELDLKDKVFQQISTQLLHYYASEWENLSRRCVPSGAINAIDFDVCYRWWGKNTEGEEMELDMVSQSIDKKHLLVGECKWGEIKNPNSILNTLIQKASFLPFAKGKTVIPVLFIKKWNKSLEKPSWIFTPEDVMKRLK